MVTRCGSLEVGSGQNLCQEVFAPMLASGRRRLPRAVRLGPGFKEMTAEEAAKVERQDYWLNRKSAKAKGRVPPTTDYFCAIQDAEVETSTEKAIRVRGWVATHEFRVWLPKSATYLDPEYQGYFQRLWVRKTVLH